MNAAITSLASSRLMFLSSRTCSIASFLSPWDRASNAFVGSSYSTFDSSAVVTGGVYQKRLLPVFLISHCVPPQVAEGDRADVTEPSPQQGASRATSGVRSPKVESKSNGAWATCYLQPKL